MVSISRIEHKLKSIVKILENEKSRYTDFIIKITKDELKDKNKNILTKYDCYINFNGKDKDNKGHHCVGFSYYPEPSTWKEHYEEMLDKKFHGKKFQSFADKKTFKTLWGIMRHTEKKALKKIRDEE